MEEDSRNKEELADILFNGLNEHGFVFQEKCADELRNNRNRTHWWVEDTEYPVEIEERSTRIDIVLQNRKQFLRNGMQLYAIIECKRVNPLRGYWLFGQTANAINSHARIFQVTGETDKNNYHTTRIVSNRVSLDIFSVLVDNWWVQLSRKGNSDKHSTSPQPIEDAFIQVLTGVSGFAQQMFSRVFRDKLNCTIILVPVIITSAPLYYAGYDLNDVDLSKGIIDKEKVNFGEKGKGPQELEWVEVNYPVDRTLYPYGFEKTVAAHELSALNIDYQYSIYIVKSDNIVNFFSKLFID